MKLLSAALIILLISLCKADNCTELGTPISPTDCHNRNFAEKYVKCCYFKEFYYLGGKLTNETYCNHLKQEDYDTLIPRFKTQKAYIEKFGGIIDVLQLDCNSKYIYASLLILMILLL